MARAPIGSPPSTARYRSLAFHADQLNRTSSTAITPPKPSLIRRTYEKKQKELRHHTLSFPLSPLRFLSSDFPVNRVHFFPFSCRAGVFFFCCTVLTERSFRSCLATAIMARTATHCLAGSPDDESPAGKTVTRAGAHGVSRTVDVSSPGTHKIPGSAAGSIQTSEGGYFQSPECVFDFFG